MRLKGSNLIAFNEVTHKAHAVIDLTKAIRLQDPEDLMGEGTPASVPATRKHTHAASHQRTLSREDDDDPFGDRPNSFRLVFEDEVSIDFFADSAREKAKWIAALSRVVGSDGKPTKSAPLWAQMLLSANKARLRQAEKDKEKDKESKAGSVDADATARTA